VAEFSHGTSGRLKKCHEHYTSKGPHTLSENLIVDFFFDLESNLKTLFERMPGYVDCMLTKKPDFKSLAHRD